MFEPRPADIAGPPILIPPDSLARRENWPDWAQQELADLHGLMALERLEGLTERGDFYFLGLDQLREEVIQRRSQYSTAAGEYAPETASKIVLVKVAACGVLRALVNRFNPVLDSYLDMAGLGSGNGDRPSDICWSGWFPYRDTLQTVTTDTMARAMLFNTGPRFVAVCNRATLDPELIQELPEKKLETHVYHPSHDFTITPELIVPVSNTDIPPDILILNATRRQGAEAYGILAAEAKCTATLPSSVTISDGSVIEITDIISTLIGTAREPEHTVWPSYT